MTTEAYLLLFFKIVDQKPVFLGAKIASEDNDHLTCDQSGQTCVVTGAKEEGNTYKEAKDKLLKYLQIHPFFKTWIFNHLTIGELPSNEEVCGCSQGYKRGFCPVCGK
jgi:hypothetical protein